MRLFDVRAPLTIRGGTILLVVAAVLDFVRQVGTIWVNGAPSLGTWWAIARPIVSLVVGVWWAWGIAQIRGIYYWSWAAMVSAMAFVLAIVLPLSWAGLLDHGEAKPWTPLLVVEGLCLVASCALLFSKSSMGLFWKRGSPGAKSRDVV